MDAELFERAARYGIETQYHDGMGQLRTVDSEVLGRLLAALAREGEDERRLLPESVIRRGGTGGHLPLGVPDGIPVAWTIFSDGRILAQGHAGGSKMPLPGDLPQGIFRLRLAAEGSRGTQTDETPLIVCPQQAYQGEQGRRMWGLGVQLYAVRSQRNWGHGDFTDLLDLIAIAADHGASAIGLNPLHALFEE